VVGRAVHDLADLLDRTSGAGPLDEFAAATVLQAPRNHAPADVTAALGAAALPSSRQTIALSRSPGCHKEIGAIVSLRSAGPGPAIWPRLGLGWSEATRAAGRPMPYRWQVASPLAT
jgi:hypothetical protein